jgi:hypothetical protein
MDLAMPLFATFGLASQGPLVAFFAAHLRQSSAEPAPGRLVYGLGAVAALLAVAFLVAGQPAHLVLALALYAAWSAFGAWVDLVRPVPWREPSRLSIVVPYAVVLTAALIALWVPLWWFGPRPWAAFGVLFGVHTILNAASHRAARTAAPVPGPGDDRMTR